MLRFLKPNKSGLTPSGLDRNKPIFTVFFHILILFLSFILDILLCLKDRFSNNYQCIVMY